MKKTEGIKFVWRSSLAQLLSIPIIYWIIFKVGGSFIEPVKEGSQGLDFYGFTLISIELIVLLSIPLLVYFQEFVLPNKWINRLLHLILISMLIRMSYNDFEFHPYRHSLVIGSIATTLISKEVFSHFFHK